MTEQKDDAKKREALRKNALTNINSELWDYALPKLMTFENFGRFSEHAKVKYASKTEKAPSQFIYETLFLPQLASNRGAVTSPYIQETSAAIIQGSFMNLKVEDIYKYAGMKLNLKGDYKDKYVADLDEEEVQEIISGAMNYGLNKKISELAGDENKAITSGLEKLLCEEPKPKEEKK